MRRKPVRATIRCLPIALAAAPCPIGHKLARRYERRRDDEQLRPPVQFTEGSRGDAGANDGLPKLGLAVAAWSRSQLAGRKATEPLRPMPCGAPSRIRPEPKCWQYSERSWKAMACPPRPRPIGVRPASKQNRSNASMPTGDRTRRRPGNTCRAWPARRAGHGRRDVARHAWPHAARRRHHVPGATAPGVLPGPTPAAITGIALFFAGGE